MNLIRNLGTAARVAVPLLLGGALASPALAAELRLELGGERSPSAIQDRIDLEARRFGRAYADLTRAARERLSMRRPFSQPVRVVLVRNGVPLPESSRQGRQNGDLTLQFDATGARAFPTAYQSLLERTFASARPAINAVYGAPAQGGVVRVRNYDADIQDRYAVAGGVYVANGPDGPEIRFPVYNNAVSASVNFVHTLLLAYQGAQSRPFDAWSEGMARAATMRIVRQAGSLPDSPEADQIESALVNYDASAYYDWANQPALGSPRFIAPNLLNVPLPIGGSLGGLYLLRHQMAGTAWHKAIVQQPGFLAEFNRRAYATPAGGLDSEAELVDLAFAAMQALVGGANPVVEGLPIRDWIRRQHALDPTLTPGLKTLVQPLPLPPSTVSDFAVFDIWLHAFMTLTSGDETLLSGASYPIFWRPDGERFFTAAQDDVIGVQGAFGSVTPNFPSETFGGEPYRVAVDLPFQDQAPRAYLPAGGVQPGVTTPPNTFYGTLTGVPYNPSQTYRVTVSWPGGSQSADFRRLAFGMRITDAAYLAANRLDVKVFRLVGGAPTDVIVERQVNKGPGELGVDLRVNDGHATFTTNLAAALRGFGVPLQPYRPNLAFVLQQQSSQTLAARWDPLSARYRFFPSEGAAMQGYGFFLRAPAAKAITVEGRASPNTPISVALKPGWNLVSSPLPGSTSTANVLVTRGAGSVVSYAEAIGTLVANTFFRLEPDPADPEKGSLVPSTTFEAGQAYFVRALQAEGAVLSFQPASGAGPRASVLRSFKDRYTWEKRLTLRSDRGAWTQTVIGASPQGSRGFEPKLDCELPAGPGGLAMASVLGRALYRDIRRVGTNEAWTLALTGLRPGVGYTVLVDSPVGRRTALLIDPETGTRIRITTTGAYRFVARATSKTLRMEAGAF